MERKGEVLWLCCRHELMIVSSSHACLVGWLLVRMWMWSLVMNLLCGAGCIVWVGGVLFGGCGE